MLRFTSCLIVFCLTLSAFADDSVSYIQKGQPAPYTGYVITPERAKRFSDLGLDYDFQKKRGDLLDQENSLLNQRLTNDQEHINNLSKQLAETRDSAFLSKLGMFLLGAAVTTGIAYGVSRAAR